MNRPSSGRGPEVETVGRKPAGRLRGYAVPSGPRPTGKATKFRCRHCGQKVWVEAALAREVITCPTCGNQIRAPHPGRLWLEVCGGIMLFLSGFALGQGRSAHLQAPIPAPAAVIQDDGKMGAGPKQAVPKPRWLASPAD